MIVLFPVTLKILDCSCNKQLKILPELPKTLKTLNCYDCIQLEHIPELPKTLKSCTLSMCNKLSLSDRQKWVYNYYDNKIESIDDLVKKFGKKCTVK